MTWQAYVDDNLIGTGKVAKAAIFGTDGSLWATSAGYNVNALPFLSLSDAFLQMHATVPTPPIAGCIDLGWMTIYTIQGNNTYSRLFYSSSIPSDIVGWSCRSPQADCSIRKHWRNCRQRPLSWGQKIQLPSQRRRKHLRSCELFFLVHSFFHVVLWYHDFHAPKLGGVTVHQRSVERIKKLSWWECGARVLSCKKIKNSSCGKKKQQQQTSNSTFTPYNNHAKLPDAGSHVLFLFLR